MTHHNDMLIIGAGILGLSHAYAAAKGTGLPRRAAASCRMLGEL
jgi:glycine/D-amino acid oxidase-like deaminating enzyme